MKIISEPEIKDITFSEEAQKTHITRRKKKTGLTTVMARRVRCNLDLLWLGLALLAVVIGSFTVARIVYGVTAKQFVAYVWDVATVIISFVSAAIFIMLKMHTMPGAIASEMQKGNYKTNIDAMGNTVDTKR